MKKILALALAAAMSMSILAGCGRNKVKNPNYNNNTTPPATNETVPNTPNTTVPNTPNDNAEVPGKDTNPTPETTPGGNVVLRENTTLEDVVVKLGEELGITMPQKVDDATLKDVFGINPEDIEEYYGEYSVVNTSADHILAFKVKEGKMADVRKALESRRDTVVKNFEQYLPDQLEKAKNATIIEKGNYIFFVIGGNTENGIEKVIDRTKEMINSFF